MKYLSRFILPLAMLTMSVPQITTAATTQQSFNDAITQTMTRVPMRIDGRLKIHVTGRAVTKDGMSGTGDIAMHLTSRVVSRDKTSPQNEGSFSIDTVNITTTTNGVTTPITLDQPITLQTKQVGTKLYVQLAQLPQNIQDMAKGFFDINAVVGQWIVIDLSDLTKRLEASAPSATAPHADILSNPSSIGDLITLSQQPAFLVTGIEKHDTDANGHAILRVRLRINPRLIAALQRIELNKISATDPNRRTKIAALNTQYTQLRKIQNALHIAANVDLTDNLVQRLEFAGTQTMPNKTCSFNRSGRSICHTSSIANISYSASLSFTKDAGEPVQEPAGALTFQQLLDKLTPTSTTMGATSTTP